MSKNAAAVQYPPAADPAPAAVLLPATEPTVSAAASPTAVADPAAAVADPAPNASPTAKTGKEFLDAFGPQGAVWFVEGKTWDEAQLLHMQGLQKQNDALSAKLAAVQFGQPEPVSAGDALAAPERQPLSAINLRVGGSVARIAAGIAMPKPSNN